MKKVSVIVPIYNELIFLDDCINSIRNQTYNNIEIILVDDGSTISEVSKKCDVYGKKDNRIKVIHKKNAGLSAARISGLKQATGEWIMFVDNDDIIVPWMIEDLVACIDSSQQIDIIAGNRINMENIPQDLFYLQDKNFKTIVEVGKNICEKIGQDHQKTIITPLWGKIYRKEFLDEFNLEKYKDICPTIFFEDVLMTPILYYHARNICLISKVLYIHREVSTSISRSGKLSSFYYEQIDSGRVLLEFYKKNNLRDMYSYQLSLYYRTIVRIYVLLDKKNLGDSGLEYYFNKIWDNYSFYYKDYCKYNNDSIVNRIIIKLFRYNKKITKRIVRKFYYKL